MKPVRKLVFKARENGYKTKLDLNIERPKAIKVKAILDDEEDVESNLTQARKDIITIKARGRVRPIAMRRIIEILAS